MRKPRSSYDYICASCSIRRGVKMYTFAEEGFLHQINLCECCAEERGVMQLASEYLKKQREENERNNRAK